jgi:acetolactate synthase-1/2/3 large subunit
VPSCGEALIRLLERDGAELAFGIPGVHTLELYRGLAASSVRHVTPRHEQGAAFMADAWARVTGNPGLCVLISGPGLTNAITPIAQAHHDSVPMLVVSGVVPEARRGEGEIHDLPDQQGLMAKVTAFSHEVRSPQELPEVLARAREVFASRRPRPVHLQIPVDVLRAEAGDVADAALSDPPPPPVAPEDAVEAAADRLAAARSPLVLLGGGARDAGPQALRVARLAGAPVGLTINGRGAIDHDDPLCLGSALSFPPADALLREADAVLMAGAEFSDLETWGSADPIELRGLIRVDIDAEQLGRRHAVELGLHGDASTTLDAIADALGRRGRNGADKGAAARARAVRDGMRWPPEVSDFAAIVGAIDRAMPRDRIIAADSTKPAYAANHSLPMHQPRSWLMPIGYGCLGCALPMAIGAKLAAPHRPVLALAGDGGVLFTIQELATARDLGLALPIVVFDNRGYGEIRDAMDGSGIPHLGTEVATHDLPAVARGFGCEGVRVGVEELEEAIAAALGAAGPTVLEVRAA